MALRTLLKGMKGADVAALQRLISYYDPGPNTKPFVDGDFGARTQAALEAYKRQNGERIDSIATPEWQAQHTNAAIGFPAQPGPWPPKGASSAPSSSGTAPSTASSKLPVIIGGVAALGLVGLFVAAFRRRKVGSKP